MRLNQILQWIVSAVPRWRSGFHKKLLRGLLVECGSAVAMEGLGAFLTIPHRLRDPVFVIDLSQPISETVNVLQGIKNGVPKRLTAFFAGFKNQNGPVG
jgi:hypothetical protein